ncbi:MAG TPA: hypothetical protein PLW67_10270, partial [Prolixibacteraceae bacterium]|nr:hypothetical protein [Prolixibacteraceae bacterium]
MYKNLIILCVLLVITFSSTAQQAPNKADVLKAMTLANDYFMQKWPDPGKPIVNDKTRPSNIWTRASYYEGLMALYATDPKPQYLDYAVRWGESH